MLVSDFFKLVFGFGFLIAACLVPIGVAWLISEGPEWIQPTPGSMAPPAAGLSGILFFVFFVACGLSLLLSDSRLR
jgi:hypothetical protein